MSQGPLAPTFGVTGGVSAISGTAHAGTPVYRDDDSTFLAAFDNSNTVSACVGLLIRPCANGDVAAARFCGPLTLEVDQWNQILSDEESPDGLQPGKTYYLNDDAGRISVTVPEGAVTQKIGIASSEVTLLVGITGPNDINAS